MDVRFTAIICFHVQVQGGPAAGRGEELPLILPGKLQFSGSYTRMQSHWIWIGLMFDVCLTVTVWRLR